MMWKRPIESREDASASSTEIFINLAAETTERLSIFHILAQNCGSTKNQDFAILQVGLTFEFENVRLKLRMKLT